MYKRQAVDRRAGTYSKGMKQRLGIADILIKDPDVLIMDETTNGIDVYKRQAIYRSCTRVKPF